MSTCRFFVFASVLSSLAWAQNDATSPAESSSSSSPVVNLADEVDIRRYEDLRFGFVNIRRIMGNIPQVGRIGRQLDEEFSDRQREQQRLSEEVAQLEATLRRTPRGDEYFFIEKQVIAKKRDMVRSEEAFRDDYSVRRNEELAKLQRLIVDEIVALAKQYDFDVILNDTGVIYVSEKADLTSSVIRRLLQRAEEEQ